MQDMSFDAVVLATPLEHTNIEFSALQLPGESEGMRKREYMLTHVTFVVGELRLDDYFGLEKGAKQPNNIITPETDAVDFTRFVWRIIAEVSLNGTAASLFIHNTRWKASAGRDTSFSRDTR